MRVVNQLLTEMDGLEARKQVFVMAATNRPGETQIPHYQVSQSKVTCVNCSTPVNPPSWWKVFDVTVKRLSPHTPIKSSDNDDFKKIP